MNNFYLSQAPATRSVHALHPYPAPLPDIWYMANKVYQISSNPCFCVKQLLSDERNAALQMFLLIVLFVTMICFLLVAVIPLLFHGNEEGARVQTFLLYAIIVMALAAEFMATLHYLEDLNV
jgi:uncharacterized BrkB/YihY/UPF0761 family membrane protein